MLSCLVGSSYLPLPLPILPLFDPKLRSLVVLAAPASFSRFEGVEDAAEEDASSGNGTSTWRRAPRIWRRNSSATPTAGLGGAWEARQAGFSFPGASGPDLLELTTT